MYYRQALHDSDRPFTSGAYHSKAPFLMQRMLAVSKFKNEAVSEESAFQTRGRSRSCSYGMKVVYTAVVVWFWTRVQSDAQSTLPRNVQGDVIGPKPDYFWCAVILQNRG